ncbi:MAG TPA: acetoacetate decarboxylase family protein [Gammaproteobacteria bacterium]|nr:acetoacetate decarboxylase family protein [Gammaproteobacteria bacterium]
MAAAKGSAKRTRVEARSMMPLHSPPFGPPPYPMLECRMLMVELRADPAEIRRITPEPLEPADRDRLFAFVADNSQLSHSLRYHEAAILQRVRYGDREGVTTPYIWTSTDTAMLAGRELYGMPKLMCDDGALEVDANEVYGRLEKYGRTMMELSIVIDRAGRIGDLPFGSDWVFVRHIPTPDPRRPALRQLVWIGLTDFALQECWLGRGWAGLGHPGSSGLHRLGAAAAGSAWYGRFSWMLGDAEILEETEIPAR